MGGSQVASGGDMDIQASKDISIIPEQRATVIEFPKHRKIFIDGFVFVPAAAA